MVLIFVIDAVPVLKIPVEYCVAVKLSTLAIVINIEFVEMLSAFTVGIIEAAAYRFTVDVPTVLICDARV
jgi:hypothetical protein